MTPKLTYNYMGRQKGKTKKRSDWGKRLADVMRSKGISIRAAGRIAKVQPSVVDNWIATSASPTSLEGVKTLAEALGVEFCWLLTGSYEKSAPSREVSPAELFESLPYFDGYARIRIDRLVPRSKKGGKDEK